MTPTSVKPFYFLIETDGYIKENGGKKCLTLIPTDKRKDILKKYEKIWSKFEDFIRSTNKKKYMKKYMIPN